MALQGAEDRVPRASKAELFHVLDMILIYIQMISIYLLFVKYGMISICQVFYDDMNRLCGLWNQ